MAVAIMTFAISANAADDKYVAGGFEANGHINTGFGFNYVGNNAANNGGAAGMLRDGWAGFRNVNYAKDWGYLLDEVELDITKSFGENIKARADIAFGDQTIGSTINGVALKQAYVTANIAAGNGIEWLFGRFDAPIGYEAVDRNDNNTVTHSAIFNYNIRPRSLTGMKFYYAFSDAIDFHLWFANNLRDRLDTFRFDNKIMPAIGTRVGYTWGEEGTESTVGLSAAMSPEVNAGSKLGRMSYFADLDWNVWATDAFVIGGEGIFRRDNAPTGATSTMIFGGILDLNYIFSDVWDGTLKYSIVRINNGAGTATTATFAAPTYAAATTAGIIGTAASSGLRMGNNELGIAKGYLQEISLSPGYQIADGAKFRCEYKLDWTKYSGFNKNLTHTLVGLLEYAF